MNTTSKRDADILALARAGVTYQHIGQLFGITRARANQIALAAGISRDLSKRNDSNISPEQQAQRRAGMIRGQAHRLLNPRRCHGAGGPRRVMSRECRTARERKFDSSTQRDAARARQGIRLARQRAWRGPTPEQHDDFAERLTYDLAILERAADGDR